MGMGMLQSLLLVIMLASGGIGVPLGMPPGPEDPMLGRFAPKSPEAFLAWTGVKKPEGNDPSTAWMAKPKIQSFAKKMMSGLGKLAPPRVPNESEADVLQRLFFTSVESAIFQGGSVFASGLKFSNRQPQCDAAMLIPIRSRKSEFEQLLGDLESAARRESEPQCRFIKKQGQVRVVIKQDVTVELVIQNDYLVLGLGAGMLDQGLENMRSDPPGWFSDARKRLTVGQFSSMAFVSSKCLRDVELPIDQFFDLRAVESICFVSGIDDAGSVTRSAIELRSGSQLETLLPSKPLSENELMRLPPRSLVGFETTLPVESVVDFVADVGKQIGDDPLAEAEEQIQAMFGLSLKEELLHFFDGTVSASMDFDLAKNLPKLMAVVGIKDDMSFPAVYQTVVDAISNWPEVQGRLEKTRHRQYEIYEFSPQQGFVPIGIAWAHVDDQLIIASDSDLVIEQIDRAIDGGGFAKTTRAQQLVAFGAESGLGNPVMVTTLDPVKLMEIYYHFASMWGAVNDTELLPDFTLRDLPALEVLAGGVDVSANGIYRTETGLQTFGRNTLPGSSPPVTAVALGTIAIARSQTAKRRFQISDHSDDSMRQILLACLDFEVEFQSFPAAATVDAEGKPLLSWRVHVLPFLNQDELYQRFHLDEPWDSEHNKTLIKEMPSVYCHRAMKVTDGKTVYLGIAGDGGVLGTSQPTPVGKIGFRELTDGSSNTILAVAVEPSSAVIWSRPRDLDIVGGGDNVIELTDENEAGTVIGFCDGSDLTVNELPAENWRSLMSIADGEIVDREELEK